MKKIFLFILFCLSVCSMSAYDFLRAVKDEIPGGYNFWVYTPVDYFYSQEQTPVIIFLHGASLCGRNLNKVRRYGPLDAIVKGRDIDHRSAESGRSLESEENHGYARLGEEELPMRF